MKKFVVLILVLVCVLGLIGCCNDSIDTVKPVL